MSNVSIYDLTTSEGIRKASRDYVEFLFSDSAIDKLQQALLDANRDNPGRVNPLLGVLRTILSATVVVKNFGFELFGFLTDSGVPFKFIIKLLLEEGKREGLSEMTIKVSKRKADDITVTTSSIGSISVKVEDTGDGKLTIYANFNQDKSNILPPSK